MATVRITFETWGDGLQLRENYEAVDVDTLDALQVWVKFKDIADALRILNPIRSTPITRKI